VLVDLKVEGNPATANKVTASERKATLIDSSNPRPSSTSFVDRSQRRLILLRVMAMLAGLFVFAVVEGVFWLCGLGQPDVDDDPFVGFSDLQPLFVHDAEAHEYLIPKSRQKFFAADAFPDEKSVHTTRVFCLGGSTVQGRPFSTETSFTTWLRLALETSQPDRRWEVVNCGGISYASYRLVPILQECLQYEPDLFVICTGHNEFLEDRTYGDIRDIPAVVAMPHQWLARTRSYHVYRSLLLGPSDEKSDQTTTVLTHAVETFLDYHNGLKAFRRDEVWRSGVIRHFDFNLNRMLGIARDAEVPVLLMRPPSNLGDTAPFKSELRPTESAEQRKNWRQLTADALSLLSSNPHESLRLFDEALQIHDEYAATHFWRGKVLESLGQFDLGREAFVRARDEDICPLRVLGPMERGIAAAAARWNVPLLDAHELLEQETRHGILDNSMLVDHVHPTFEGHQLIGLALMTRMQDLRLVELPDGWRSHVKTVFAQHFDLLPRIYFLRGERNLDGLRYWTQGLADGPPIETRFPERVGDE
jgi:hypothetical protein